MKQTVNTGDLDKNIQSYLISAQKPGFNLMLTVHSAL